ncbi:MAG: hypothetical protein FJX23_02240 [Alphaproteobacteria bacterium]|nr:hypothetical protein [Alphaproteobacteria bacterium]
MVFFIQLAVFAAVYFFNLRRFSPRGLKPLASNPRYVQRIDTNKGRTTARYIGVAEGGGFPFMIVREKWYHRFLKKLGIAHEIQLGDKELDEQFFFITDHSQHLAQAMRSEVLQNALRTVFVVAKQFNSDKGRGWCSLKNSALSMSDPLLARHWQAVEVIQKEMAKVSVPQNPNRRLLRTLALFFLAAHAAFFVTAMMGFVPTFFEQVEITQRMQWAVTSAAVAAIVLAGWFVLILHFFRNSSWSALVIVDFALFGVLGIAVCSVYMVREYNVHFDSQPEAVVAQPVTGKFCKVTCGSGKRKTTYSLDSRQCDDAAQGLNVPLPYSRCSSSRSYKFSLKVRHWRESQKAYDFRVNRDIYRNTKYSHTALIPVHGGALDIEWVDTDAIAIENR